jgi:hypothetical protein
MKSPGNLAGAGALAPAPLAAFSVGFLAVALSAQAEDRNPPVTEQDVRILLRATDLLKEESAWNRSDDRVCEDDERQDKRSLFCALQKACIDVLGEYQHRRAALQEVRFVVQEVTRGREFAHRLRDYNNLPETSLADIKRVLSTALERVRQRLKSTKR